MDNIYINSGAYQNMEFVKKGDNFVKKRTMLEKKELNFTPFLSLECSNICFNEESDLTHSTFFSEEIEDFKAQTTSTSPIIGLANPKNLNILPSCTKVN